jgi:hypothetical protein
MLETGYPFEGFERLLASRKEETAVFFVFLEAYRY